MKVVTKQGLYRIGGVLLVLIVIGFITNHNSSAPVKGLVISQDTFNTGCVPKAYGDGSKLTMDQATTYCTCVFNEGTAYYGGEQWTRELQQLGDSNTLTPKMNDFVNDCIQGAQKSSI